MVIGLRAVFDQSKVYSRHQCTLIPDERFDFQAVRMVIYDLPLLQHRKEHQVVNISVWSLLFFENKVDYFELLFK